ncbi:MAG TPA: Xaa-Pro dipeptidase [Woeseiaceae bacterium]|nr:Xaa-Pro dipeptidase [Woeseiaceae bacterium]
MSNDHYADPAELARLYPAHVEEMASRFDRALSKAGAGHALVFSGAAEPVFLDDSYHPFKANPHFVSWLPLTDAPLSYVVYTPGNKPVLVYYQPKDYWHQPPATPAGFWIDHYDVRIVHSPEDVAKHLPDNRDHCVLIGKVQDPAQAFGIERINPTTVLNTLHYARAVKTAYELECMRGASRRAVAGHRGAEEAFRSGLPEYDIHLAYCRAVSHTERELPYGNIVALNENGAVMHYQHQARDVPDEVRSLLIDAGAELHGYASDVTRTWSFASSEFRDLIARMDRLQQELVGQVRTGIDFIALHLEAHRKLAEVLRETELASGTVNALIANGVTSAFFPTGLGHLLGIQVHDVGGFMADENGRIIDRPSGHPWLRLTRRLETDMVLTVEPGLYVIDMLLENLVGTPAEKMVNARRVAWLRPFGGIRIEDDVRVLEDGCENFTRDAFAAL